MDQPKKAKKKSFLEMTDEEKARWLQQSKTGKSNVRRSKGHERQIAKWLTEWSGREFRRRRVEGRDATVIERESTADVIAVRDDIHCSIEAKCGQVQTFAALMENPKKALLTQWWHQATYDVALVSKVFNRKFYPMMFFRPYLNQNWMAIDADLFKVLKPRGGVIHHCTAIWFPHLLFDTYNYIGEVSFNVIKTKNKANFKFIPLQLPAMVICRWQDFAKHVEPDSFFLYPKVLTETAPSSESAVDSTSNLQ